jgi:hypothetical protein
LLKSLAGTSHTRENKPCQDSCLASSFDSPHGSIAVIVVSDGAGSALYSDHGSATTCRMIADLASTTLQDGKMTLVQITPETVMEWINAVRAVLGQFALERAVPMKELACTLLCAIVGEEGAVFFQIGDGVIVRKSDDSYEHVFWPATGEYANTTYFITDNTVEPNLLFCFEESRIDELAVLSDGLQMLALSYVDKKVFAPFFLPLFQTLRQTAMDEIPGLDEPFAQFLDSPRINERTDDDKTLVLATRLP